MGNEVKDNRVYEFTVKEGHLTAQTPAQLACACLRSMVTGTYLFAGVPEEQHGNPEFCDVKNLGDHVGTVKYIRKNGELTVRVKDDKPMTTNEDGSPRWFTDIVRANIEDGL